MNERFIFEEVWCNETYDTTTFYFIGPKEMVSDKHPEADHVTISIEFPDDKIEGKYGSASISPTKDGVDYDWTDLDLTAGEIDIFLKIYDRYVKEQE